MVLFAVYNILLGNISRQEDIVVGVPVSGRSHASLNPIVGMFVNTLAIRNRPKSGMIATDFVREVKEHFLLAYTHQDYPFEELVSKLNVSGRQTAIRSLIQCSRSPTNPWPRPLSYPA